MSSITSAAGVGGGSVGASSGFGGMDSEEFVKIIFTELQNQDPFSPNDSSALLEQLNSIRSIESDMALTSQLESIVFQNQLAGASNLIGRYIQGMAPGGNRVDGQVISVIRQGDNIGVELDTGWVIDVDQVELIVDEAIFNDGADGTNNGNGYEGSGLTDVNGDGTIDGSDLSILLGQWSEFEQGQADSEGDTDDSDATDGSEGTDDTGGSDESDAEG